MEQKNLEENLQENLQHNENIQNNKNKYYCYIIRSTNPNFLNSTYNGFTNNLIRRLRQHNRKISGGAKATKGKGPWVYIAIWEGFLTHKEALSCEWRIKHPTNTKKRPSQYNGVSGRIKSLNLLIDLDFWTKKSVGMGLNFQHNYILHVSNELVGLINQSNKKSNLEIKSLEDFVIG